MRWTSIALSCLAAAAVILAAPSARADCAGPQPAFAPASGSALPASPTVYVFVPSWQAKDEAPRAFADGTALPATVTRVAENAAFVTFAVAVETGDVSSITIASGHREARYRIAQGWKRGAATTRVTGAEHRVDSWTCSFTNVWAVGLAGDAPAFRVEWARSAAVLAAGAGGHGVFPRNQSGFWYGASQKTFEAPAVLELGHPNCFAWTIDRTTLAGGGLYIRVTPLFADGSEGEATEIVEIVAGKAADEVPAAATDAELEAAVAEASAPAPATTPAPSIAMATEPRPPLSGWTAWRTCGVALVGGALLGLGLALGWTAGRRSPRRLVALATVAAAGVAVPAAAAGLLAWPNWLLAAAAALLLAVLGCAVLARRTKPPS